MERLTHERKSGMKTGYWSPNKKQELVNRLAMYEDWEESADFGKWIPCSERLPKDRQIVVADIECSIEDRMCIFAYFKIVDHMEHWINANTGFPVWFRQCCSVDTIAGTIQGGAVNACRSKRRIPKNHCRHC